MSLKLVTQPASEPISTIEAKTQLRIDHNDEDTFIDGLVTAARQYLEEVIGRSFLTQTWRLSLDDWPEDDTIELPRPPLQEVTSVVYLDEAGDDVTLPEATYIVDTDSEPGRIVLAANQVWPAVELYPANPIRITYVAGYGDEAGELPQWIKQAIYLLLGHWYENREDTITGTIIKDIPLGVESLIWLDRVIDA
jgi:uncharacterized phiE125 gp8 family phage protein